MYKHYRQYSLYPEITAGEVKHFFTPKEGIVDSYVVEETVGEKEKKITDFVSFYTVNCSVLKHETIKEYKVCSLILSLNRELTPSIMQLTSIPSLI